MMITSVPTEKGENDMCGDIMTFPDTVEEFMEQYKMVDREQIYSNGCEYVPIYRMKQWFAHKPQIDIVRCGECKYYEKFPTWSACTYWSDDPYEQASVNDDDFCSYGERRMIW